MLRLARYLLVALLVLHIAWSIFIPAPSTVRDLYLYNAIWFCALAVVISAPLEIDRVAIGSIALAISFWGGSSLANTLIQLTQQESRFTIITQLGYSLFYPLLMIAIPRIFAFSHKFAPIELLDILIVGLGLTSIIATSVSTIIFPDNLLANTRDFFLIFYPIADLALLLIIVLPLFTQRINRQSFILTLGILIFAVTDIYYLWLALNSRYAFGGLADSGWLIAIVFIALSTSIPGKRREYTPAIHPALVALAIFISPVLLAISALRPNTFPLYILIPSIANLILAFIRMSSALREARALNDERLLARTDELTGLANRRRLLSEIEAFSSVEGALLLLDLDQFKPVNDQHGHEVGDLVLREVAKRFSRSLPEGAILARLGGDEFGVLIPGRYEETIEAAYALRASLTYPCSINGYSLTLGVSIGYVQNDGAGNLLKRADEAMYRAKQMELGVAQS